MRKVELHRVLVVPLQAVHAEEWSLQAGAERGVDQVVRAGAEQAEQAVHEEDEASAWSQDAGGFRNPGVGIAPDRSAVFAEGKLEAGVLEGQVFSVAEVDREVQVVVRLHGAGRFNLLRRDVDSYRIGPSPGQPGREIGGAAAELDDVHAVEVCRERLNLHLGNLQLAPGDVLLGPRANRVPGEVGCLAVPLGAILQHMVGQVCHGHAVVAPWCDGLRPKNEFGICTFAGIRFRLIPWAFCGGILPAGPSLYELQECGWRRLSQGEPADSESVPTYRTHREAEIPPCCEKLVMAWVCGTSVDADSGAVQSEDSSS